MPACRLDRSCSAKAWHKGMCVNRLPCVLWTSSPLLRIHSDYPLFRQQWKKRHAGVSRSRQPLHVKSRRKVLHRFFYHGLVSSPSYDISLFCNVSVFQCRLSDLQSVHSMRLGNSACTGGYPATSVAVVAPRTDIYDSLECSLWSNLNEQTISTSAAASYLVPCVTKQSSDDHG